MFSSGQLLLFILGANGFVGSIIGAYFGELGAANDALGFEFPLGGSTEAGPRNRQEAAGFDGAASQFADAIGAAVNAVQSSLDFVKGTLLGGKHAQGPIAVVGIGGGIGQMLASAMLLYTRYAKPFGNVLGPGSDPGKGRYVFLTSASVKAGWKAWLAGL